MNLEPYLRLMAEHHASDLYLTTGSTIKMRVDGRLRSVGKTVLDTNMITSAVEYHLNEEQRQRLAAHGQIDMALTISDTGRYRFGIFRQRGMPAIAIRFIPQVIPSLDSLGLPDIIATLAQLRRGLLLVVGSTGAGKSTTLASILDWRNANIAEHILTVEDGEFPWHKRYRIPLSREYLPRGAATPPSGYARFGLPMPWEFPIRMRLQDKVVGDA